MTNRFSLVLHTKDFLKIVTCCLLLVFWGQPSHAQSDEDRAAYRDLMQGLQSRLKTGPTLPVVEQAVMGLPLAERVHGADSMEFLQYLGGVIKLNFQIGRRQENIPLLERLVEIGDGIELPDAVNLSYSKSQLADLIKQARPYRARRLALESHEALSTAVPPGHPARLFATQILAGIHMMQENIDDALPLFKAVVEAELKASARGKPPNPVWASSYLSALIVSGDFETAVSVSDRMLEATQSLPPFMRVTILGLRATALIGEGTPGGVSEADDILRFVMRASSPATIDMATIELFDFVSPLYTGIGKPDEFPEIVRHFLDLAQGDEAIPPVYEIALASLLARIDSERYGDRIETALQAARKAFGDDHPDTLGLALQQAGYLTRNERFERARALVEKTIVETEAQELTDASSTGYGLLTMIEGKLGNKEAAIGYGEKNLDSLRARFGLESEAVLSPLLDHVALLQGAGRREEADQLLEEGLGLASSGLGNGHPVTARFLMFRSVALHERGEVELAMDYLERAIDIATSALPPGDPTILMMLYARTSRLIAQPGFRESLDHLVETVDLHASTDDPMRVMVAALLAFEHFQRTEDAARFAAHVDTMALDIDAWPAGLDQHVFPTMLILQALVRLEDDPDAAFAAIQSIRERFGDGVLEQFGEGTIGQLMLENGFHEEAAHYFQRELQRTLDAASKRPDELLQFTRNLAHFRLMAPDLFKDSPELDPFFLMQWPLERRAKHALELSALRFQTDDPELAGLLRAQQDRSEQLDRLNGRLEAAYSGTDTERAIALQAELTAARQALNVAKASLDRAAPGFDMISGGTPLTYEQVVPLLKPGEALLLLSPTQFAPDNGTVTLPGLAYLVRWDGQVRAEPLDPGFIHSTGLRSLRCGIYSRQSYCAAHNAAKRPDSLGVVALKESEDQRGAMTTGAVEHGFHFDLAHEMYTELLGPVEDLLEDVDHLIFVPGDETMAALPLGLLLREPVNPALRGEDAYRNARWLIQDMAVTMLPSVSSLATQRDPRTLASSADLPFLGIGDPVIGRGRAMDCDAPQLAHLRRDLGDAVQPGTLMSAGGERLSDPDALRQLSRLPDTRCELQAIRSSLGGGDLLLETGATETRLRELDRNGDLMRYRVLSFATHGLMAGEVGAAEPGLVLTPPDTATREDDGLLTASEIATFELDADLVLLSACNTAAGTTANGETLSGLARAFFYAGARRILVSHWPVDSDAAVRLTTTSFDKIDSGEAPDLAFALRASILDVLEDPRSGMRELHPRHWGAFSLVGIAH